MNVLSIVLWIVVVCYLLSSVFHQCTLPPADVGNRWVYMSVNRE